MITKATIVFQKNWDAIHAVDENGKRKYKYIINTGSSRSSKTYSLIDCYDFYARENTNKRLTVWRDTKTDCRKTVLVDMLKHHKKTGRYKLDYNFHKTESIFTYSTDSTVEIHGTDDEETVHGLTQDAAWLNEPYKISRDTFDQIDQRTSDFIFIDWNPKKNHWIDILSKQDNAIVIHSTFKDNPFCPSEQRIKIESYQPISESKAVTNGLISVHEARSYNLNSNSLNIPLPTLKELSRCVNNEEKQTSEKYKWEVYGLGLKGERPNRIFKFKEMFYHEYLQIEKPVFYGVDWGVVDPMGIIEAKYEDGRLYLHEISYKSETTLKSELSLPEREQIQKHIDEGFLMWYFQKLAIDKDRPVICDNNRPGKIIALRKSGFEKAISAVKGPGSIIDGIDILSNLEVFYTHTSQNIKYEQENYSRETDKRTGEVLEDPEDNNNHTIDPARYIVQFLVQYDILRIL